MDNNKPIGRKYIEKLDYYPYLADRGLSFLKSILIPNSSYLIPDFNCPEVDNLFKDYNHSYYHVNDDLSIDWDKLDIARHNYLYVVNYFGMDRNYPPMNISLLEDNVFHYNFGVKRGFPAYIGFNSFRKILPTFGLSIVKSTVVLNEPNKINIESSDTHRIINNTHYNDIQCRGNYATLELLLNKISIQIFPRFYSFYSIRLKKRDKVQAKLFGHNIFLPIYWKDTKNKLSDIILQIPVDARYNSADMERVAKLILKYL